MPDPAPMDAVLSRYPLAPAEDEAELQDYAEYLEALRDRVPAEDLQGIEIAVTFDARGVRSDD